MKKTVLLYGILGGLLIAALRWIEYRFLVIEHSFEIYGALIATMFAGVGLWLGRRLTHPRPAVVVREVPVRVEVPIEVPVERAVEVRVEVPTPFQRDEAAITRLGVTPRELEILEAMATGLSNREIAAQLFVSENTVKTHAARLFTKLGAERRTQAVQRAREARLIS